MVNIKRALALVAVVVSFAAGEEDFDNAKKNYKNSPAKISEEAKWISPHEESYLPYGTCNEVSNFKIVRVEEKVHYYYDHKPHVYSDHFYALFSIVRVTYRLNCKNQLQYEGAYHLFSDRKLLKDDSGLKDSERDRFKAHAHGWVEKSLSYLNSDGVFFDSISDYRFDNYGKFDQAALIESWKKQKVAFPEWIYSGIPGKKLARPVLFIHGLNSDFEVWGVEAAGKENGKDKGSESFQKGQVRKYKNGSAPDILARTQNIDNTEKNINHNGIYFFQAPVEKSGDDWIERYPHWGKSPSFSQSRKLYSELVRVLDDFYTSQGYDWTVIEDTPIDIVAHSQGGLVVKEMLRGLRNDAGEFPTGTANAANHIGKLITVNTPHFGSEMATQETKDVEDSQSGLKLILDDLDAQNKKEPNEHTLVDATINMSWYEYAAAVSEIAPSLLPHDGPLAISQILSPAMPILGYVFGSTTAAATDISLKVKGPYLGKYVAKYFVDIPGPVNYDGKIKIDALDSVSIRLRKLRSYASYLDKENVFMKNLMTGFDGGAYPLKPNGEKLVLLPLYSPSTERFLSEQIRAISEEANRICVEDDESAGCFAFGQYFELLAIRMASKSGFTVESLSDIDLNDTLLNALIDIQNRWFSSSDALVTEYSQKFVDLALGLDPAKIPEFEEPRRYNFHDALAPWEDVVHAPFGKIGDAATLQGFDIACALDFYCDEILGRDNSKMIYLNEGSVSLAGDFEIAPMFLTNGSQALRVSDGVLEIEAKYIPGKGSFVSLHQEGKVVQKDSVVGKNIAAVPTVSRIGQKLKVAFNNYSGRKYEKEYVLEGLDEIVQYSILSESGNALPKVVVGIANAADFSSQKSPETPPGKSFSKTPIAALHRESRESAEKNTSRPRILVANVSGKDIHGFRLAYYFTADPTRSPQVEIDYPKIPVAVENLGGDQWRFVIDASDVVLKADSMYPGRDGWQIRIHYADWSDYRHGNDWSANYNIGIPKWNRKIVVYDGNGKILWGSEPEPFASESTQLLSPRATLSWTDAASWETNVFKPKVTIWNSGEMALKDYHAKLWFRAPDGKSPVMPPDDWYTPVSKPSLKKMERNVWELDFHFDQYILYPKDSVQEGNVGIHLDDWSTFDKTVCGIALEDSDGNILFGKIPSVEECESFEEPNYLKTEFAWER